MSARPVTVAVPVRNGGARLEGTLGAVRRQQTERSVELLICDSGSTDGSADRARAHGARVIEIAANEFSHSQTRNLLMEQAAGEHVIFLTQDSEPASEDWIETLLSGFGVAADVGLCFGPYWPRPGAPVWVARELDDWFAGFSPDGAQRVDRLEPGESLRAPQLLGPRGFFTDANGAIAREAWAEIPFPDVPYAEDHALALALLAAGWAKVYVPDAATLHSHTYGPVAHFRRSFDEWRGLREVYGHVQPLRARGCASAIRRGVAGDLTLLRSQDASDRSVLSAAGGSLGHHASRQLGAIAGSHADVLPATIRRWASLEGRETFLPLKR